MGALGGYTSYLYNRTSWPSLYELVPFQNCLDRPFWGSNNAPREAEQCRRALSALAKGTYLCNRCILLYSRSHE